MKAKDAARLSALRMLKAAIVNKGVEKGRDLDDAEVLQVVTTLVKQRRDSIEQFSTAGRVALVDKETPEITAPEHYLPPAASAEEIDAAVIAAIAETGASSPKDMGKVMKAVMPRLAGKNADGCAESEAVRRKLGASLSSSKIRARALRRVGRSRHDDQPNPRSGPRPGACVDVRRGQRDGRVQRRVPDPQSRPRSVCGGRHERGIRAGVHATADGCRKGICVATGQQRDQRTPARHGRPGHPG